MSRMRGWAFAGALVCPLTPASGAEAEYFDRAREAEVRASTSAEDVPYLVHTGARLVLPSADVGALRQADPEEKFFVQFDRPLRAEERADLQAAGVVFYETLAPYTQRVAAPETVRALLAAHPLFRGVATLVPEDKVTESLYRGPVPEHARRPGDEVAVQFRFYRDVPLDRALGILDRLGIRVADRTRFLFGHHLEGTGSREMVLAVAASPAVRAIVEVEPPSELDNQEAAGIANVLAVNASPWSLDGDGVRVGIWDGGRVRDTHQDLSGRVTLRETQMFCSNTSGDTRSESGIVCSAVVSCPSPRICLTASDHGTHVAGTVIGTGVGNAAARGMAPGPIQMFSYNFRTGSTNTEMADSVSNDGIHLSQNSYGISHGYSGGADAGDGASFGVYNSLSTGWDELVRDTDLIIMKSAGNEGNDCKTGCDTAVSTACSSNSDCPSGGTCYLAGFCSNASTTSCLQNSDCPVGGICNLPVCDGVPGSDGINYDILSDRDLAKNILTIGAINDDGSTLTSFSSAGPPDDGRIKPEFVANGDDLFSTGAVADNDYDVKSGTSMSTPTVSGVVALLVERWQDFHTDSGVFPNNPPPELVKALLANTATDLGRTGPDYAYGHGSVNALKAVQQLEAPNAANSTFKRPNQHRIGFIDEGELLEFLMTTPAPTGPLEMALAWTDLAGKGAAPSTRYCNWLNLKIPCTSNDQCDGPICLPDPCGAGVACDLKNDLNGYIKEPLPGNSVVAVTWLGPGASNVTGAASQGVNHVDNVELVRAGSRATGGDYIVRVYGFTVNEGPQRFALAANHPLTFLNPNDDFADARTLPVLVPPDPTATDCVSGQSPCPATLYPHNQWNAVNYDAGLETGEPEVVSGGNHQHSVWFRWTSRATGKAFFDTFGADFDTLLGGYTGSAVGSLTTLDQNDDDPLNISVRQSQISFDVLAGTTYYIQVGGYGFEEPRSMGVFPLNYYVIPSVCGNNVVESGEDCDDGGGSADGNCCSTSCAFESSGTSCNEDADLCTVDTCDAGGTCVAGGPPDCSDGNPCTDDVCDALSGCQNPFNSAPCEDGSACSIGDSCSSGICVSGPPPDCSDGDACTGDLCDPASGCVNAPHSRVDLRMQTISSSQTFEASVSITAGNGLVVGAPAEVTLDAPLTVFESDFTVNAGAGLIVGNQGLCSGGLCAHDICVVGVALDPTCDACATQICLLDPYCCNIEWDQQCVDEVALFCGLGCS